MRLPAFFLLPSGVLGRREAGFRGVCGHKTREREAKRCLRQGKEECRELGLEAFICWEKESHVYMAVELGAEERQAPWSALGVPSVPLTEKKQSEWRKSAEATNRAHMHRRNRPRLRSLFLHSLSCLPLRVLSCMHTL